MAFESLGARVKVAKRGKRGRSWSEVSKMFRRQPHGHFSFARLRERTDQHINSKGLEMCIITNGHHRVQRDKLEACSAYTLFENIIVGGEEVLAGRKEKPDRGIFMKACKYVGCLPSEAIHVGTLWVLIFKEASTQSY